MAAASKKKVEIIVDALEERALQYAADLVHQALMISSEPVKTSEVAKLVGRDDFDGRLARVVLVTQPDRFASTDRRWALWSRYGDPTRPLERTITDILKACGGPAPLAGLVREVSATYGRPSEIYDEMLARILRGSPTYFELPGNRFGLTEWLLDTSAGSEEDVLFDNYLSAEDLEPLSVHAGDLGASVESVSAFLDKVGEPVSSLALQALIWRNGQDEFNPQVVFTLLYDSPEVAYLSTGHWVGPKVEKALAAKFVPLANREVEEKADSTQSEAQQPLAISPEDHQQMVKWILGHDGVSHAAQVLDEIFEVAPGDATFDADLATVVEALKSADGIEWLGTDRFLAQEGVPPYVNSVPDILAFKDLHYTDLEGNPVDLELDQDGFDGGLDREIRSANVMDVLDEDPILEEDPLPPATARCVLRLHHKEIGTLPLCSLPPGFFPSTARILNVDLTLPNGHVISVWINNETRLAYGLIEWYQTLPIDSGAVFYLERQADDRYALTYGEETEPIMFVSRNRVNELIELGNRADQDELPTFEILREIMEHYRKGIEFTTVHTELNISRRTRRHMTASLLSGFHCFYQRGRAWVFDAKKLTQGFDKSKRKYLKK